MALCFFNRRPPFNIQDKYPSYFTELVKSATPVSGKDAILRTHNTDGDVRIQYNDEQDFEYIANQFGVFTEWKVITSTSKLHCLWQYFPHSHTHTVLLMNLLYAIEY